MNEYRTLLCENQEIIIIAHFVFALLLKFGVNNTRCNRIVCCWDMFRFQLEIGCSLSRNWFITQLKKFNNWLNNLHVFVEKDALFHNKWNGYVDFGQFQRVNCFSLFLNGWVWTRKKKGIFCSIACWFKKKTFNTLWAKFFVARYLNSLSLPFWCLRTQLVCGLCSLFPFPLNYDRFFRSCANSMEIEPKTFHRNSLIWLMEILRNAKLGSVSKVNLWILNLLHGCLFAFPTVLVHNNGITNGIGCNGRLVVRRRERLS